VWRWPSPPGRGGLPAQTVAWSSPSGNRLVLLQPRADLNILGLLTGTTFRQAGRGILPQPPPAYQKLQYALRTGPVTW